MEGALDRTCIRINLFPIPSCPRLDGYGVRGDSPEKWTAGGGCGATDEKKQLKMQKKQ